MRTHTRHGKAWPVGRLLAAFALAIFALPVTTASAAPPTIPLLTVSEVTTSSATLEAEVNPKGLPTQYHFEYGLADCVANLCTKTPTEVIPAGGAPVSVEAPASGLSPGTTYHLRLVAENFEGTVEANRTFATYAEPPTGLPDGRAYEQASPVDKNGGDARGTVGFTKAAASGGAISFLATVGMPVEGDPEEAGGQDIPLYVAFRGADAWSTFGQLPPAIFGPRARVMGWDAELSTMVLSAITFEQPRKETILVRSRTESPSLTQITPYAVQPEYEFASVSKDGSQVLFEGEAQLPGTSGIQGKSNVYLWERQSDEVRLASVMNDGSAPPEGAFAGPYDWVNGTNSKSVSEGGGDRKYYTRDLNVLSSTGDVLFTAAGTGQLYLRKNATEPQSPLDSEDNCEDPAKACTVEVSESKKTNGKGPHGLDAAGERPAAFMAASEDGAEVFFTSSEKLTNDANTGVEPDVAAIARANITTKPPSEVELDFLPTKASGVAVEGDFLYWADPGEEGGEGSIGRAKLNGLGVPAGPIEEEFIVPGPTKGDETEPGVFESLPSKPGWVALGNGHIYWSNSADGEASHGTIGRAKLKLDLSGVEDVDPECVKGAHNPQGIAVNATHIFWIDTTATRGIARATTACTDPLQPWTQSVTGNEFGFNLAGGIALDATYAYAPEKGFGLIRRFKLSEPKDFFTLVNTGTTNRLSGLAIEGDHIYWANTVTRTIGRAKLSNPGPAIEEEPEYIKDASPPIGVAAEGGHLYWAANQGSPPNPGNDLYRYESQSGKLSDLSVDSMPAHSKGADVQGVLGASAEGDYVYYAANGLPDGLVGSPNEAGESATLGDCDGNVGNPSGVCNLYLWRDDGTPAGETRFITRLAASSDAENWTGTPVIGGATSPNYRRSAFISADGQTLLFRSQRQLTEYDNEGVVQLYRFRVGEGILCVSCNPTGTPPLDGHSLGTINLAALTPTRPASFMGRNLAGERGERAFFETTEALVVNDTDGAAGCPSSGGYPACLDVYEWEAPGTGSCPASSEQGCHYLLSGSDAFPSIFADASASGGEAFFFSREQLVKQDEDELLDVYDARAGGGLAGQNPPDPPDPCQTAESCHGPPSPPPAEQSPTTPSFVGPGDPKPKAARKAKKKRKSAKAKKHRGKRKGRGSSRRGVRR
jgi:hypothetical protein